MAFKTRRPDYSSPDTNVRLGSLINYVEALSEEIEFKLEVLSKSIEQIRRVNSSVDKGE